MMKAAMMTMALIVSIAATAAADFFRYTDAKGVIHIVDDEDKIPERYRKNTRTIKAEKGPKEKRTAVRIERNRILVPVTFSNDGTRVTAMMLLDTGATGILIYQDVARKLNLDRDKIAVGSSRMADGRDVRTFSTVIDAVSVDDKVIYQPKIDMVNNEGRKDHEGLLGMSFLKHHPFRIDHYNSAIVWQ